MASATLNSNLLDALASRGGRIESHHTISKQTPFPSTDSIASTSYIAKAAFASECARYITEQESRENSVSGDITTEDDEGSLGENSSFFLKRSSDEFASSVKKRRKQVKPVRVRSMESFVGSNRVSPGDVRKAASVDGRNSPNDKNGQFLSCPHCSNDYLSEDSLRRHIIEDHIGRMLNEDVGLRRSYPFQSRLLERDNLILSDGPESLIEREEGEMIPLNLTSTRWDAKNSHLENGEKSHLPPFPSGMHVTSYPDGKFSLPSLIPLGPPPFVFPFLQQHSSPHAERDRMHPSQQQIKPVNNNQHQIFNLEAYCDLCNKEFCNKYFLKTHKANKHGIYNLDTGSPQLGGNSGMQPPFSPSTSNNSYTSVSITSTPLSIANHQTSPLNSIPLPGSPFPSPFITGGIPPLSMRPMLPSHLHSFQKNSLPLPKNENGNISKNGILNIEAYCEICQKEFCNKYFLKRHKSKIHNIDIEVTIKNTTKSPNDPKKTGFDRPEGWCDACRKDIGNRTTLNNHKLNVHGPHIVMHMPLNKDMDGNVYPKDENDPHQNVNDNFSPWDLKRDKQNSSKENSISDPREQSNQADMMMDDEENLRNSEHSRNNSPECPNTDDRYSSRNEKLNSCWNEEFLRNGMIKQYFEQSNYIENKVKEEPSNKTDEMDDTEVVSFNKNNDQDNGDSLKGSLDLSFNDELGHDSRIMEKEICDAMENSQSPVKDIPIPDAPMTPGGGSSTDENSREHGLIARVGQPAISQAPPGTKYTPEQLRQLGVVNADAFCELCCKEFCNKYFLRTHKIKKHGIYTPEYSDRSKQNKESSPINLASIIERQVFDLRPGIEIDLELECNICCRTFPNPHLLSIHKYCIHGPGQDIYQQQEQLLQLQNSLIQQEQLRNMQLHKQLNYSDNNLPLKTNSNALYPPKPESLHSLAYNDFDKIILERNHPFEKSTYLKEDHRKLTPESSHPPSNSPSNTENCNRNHLLNDTPTELDTSEDLRKLQTMILELNRQGEGVSRCKVCQKDLGNIYSLRAHLMTEHGILPESCSQSEVTPRPSREASPIPSPVSTPVMEAQGFCSICKKDFFSRYILQQHMLSAHGMFSSTPTPTSFIDRIRAELENKDDRKPISTSRSYCEICNKELCNKYFMKTHMLKMHGLNIENGSSGGVTCDICKKELCSKYFLKVHKQNSHGLVEDNLENDQQIELSDVKTCPVCSRKFRNIKWLQTHLNSDHGEDGKEKWTEFEASLPKLNRDSGVNSCGMCGKSMPDLISLQIHYIKHHGVNSSEISQDLREETLNQPEDNQIYQCSICSLSFPSSPLLFSHEKTHNHEPLLPHPFISHSQIIHCPLCSKAIPNIEIYQQHLLQHQLEGILKPFFGNEEHNITDEEMRPITPKTVIKVPLSITESPIQKTTTPRKRWRCSECGKKFKSKACCFTHIQSVHRLKMRYNSNKRRLFKCRKCGAKAKKLSILRKHLKRHHSTTQAVVPTARAQPTAGAGQFVMQPFLLNKEDNPDNTNGSEDGQTFVPSLVYLPVAKKIQHPLTVSFCLTPA